MNERIRAIVPDCIVRQGKRQKYQVDFVENVEGEINRAPDEVPLEQEFLFGCEFLDGFVCSSRVDVDSERG